MEQNEIIEGNKLIAHFMESITGEELGGYTEKGWASACKYHTSWDWLMPVVEQICEYDNINGADYSDCLPYINLAIFKTSILCHREAVYQRVVEFIKWYNSVQNDETSVARKAK